MTDRDDLALIGAWMRERGDHPIPPDLLGGARRRILAEDAERAGARDATRRGLRAGLGLAAGIAAFAVVLSAILPAARDVPDPQAGTGAGQLLAVESLENALVLRPVEADGSPVAGRDRLEIGHDHRRVQSPDGRTLAIFSFPDADSANGELLLVDVASWTWTRAPFTVPTDIAAPTWTADSSTLAWFEPQRMIERYSLARDYRLMHWAVGGAAAMPGAILDTAFVPEQARPAGAHTIVVYGQPVDEEYMASGVPEVLRLDVDAGTILDRALLEGVAAGQERRDPDGYRWDRPALAWDLPHERLFVIEPDLLTTVPWGEDGLSVNSRLIQPRTSLLDGVVAWLIPAAAAKTPSEGTTLSALLSPDGMRLYVTGSVVERVDGGTIRRPIGVRVVDPADGALLDELDAPIDSLALDETGATLVASGTTETFPADDEGISELAPSDLLVLDAADLHERLRVPAADGVSDLRPVGFSADGAQAYVLVHRLTERGLPVVQRLDLTTGRLNDGQFGPETMELLSLRP